MKTASIAELQERPAAILEWVEGGETVELMRGEKVVARIVPTPPTQAPASTKPVQWPDFAAMRREIYGDDLESRQLSKEDSDFIRDRGDR